MLGNYLKKVGARRLLIMILGNVFLGMGVGIFKLSGMGNDPFSGMVMALSACIGIPYPHFLVMFNVVIFVLELAFGREFIGAGTIVNACFLGYFATFFYELFQLPFGIPTLLWQRVIVVCIGVVATSFGVSLYQTPDVGVAPYDSLSLIMAKRWKKIPYFWHRMSNDAICALVCYLTGGIVGLGTLLCALGLGPFIHFFTERVSKKLVGPIGEGACSR